MPNSAYGCNVLLLLNYPTDVGNLHLCARPSKCERIVIIMFKLFICQKNDSMTVGFISWGWKIPLTKPSMQVTYNFYSPSSFDTYIGELVSSKGKPWWCTASLESKLSLSHAHIKDKVVTCGWTFDMLSPAKDSCMKGSSGRLF